MFTLDEVVPWGRSFEEYRRMFALTAEDLRGKILGGADGPASFNAEATARGARVVSCDPLYRWDATHIRERIRATAARVLAETRRNLHQFVWSDIPSVEELERVRMRAMDRFLEDYDPGRRQGRYVTAALPALPFRDQAFDLAVCSHFLFLYTEQTSLALHREALREMLRVAREVRIFPLLSLGGGISPYVESCTAELLAAGYTATIETVPHEFQRGGNQMLRAVAGSSGS
jgi:hypothetical protein